MCCSMVVFPLINIVNAIIKNSRNNTHRFRCWNNCLQKIKILFCKFSAIEIIQADEPNVISLLHLLSIGGWVEKLDFCFRCQQENRSSIENSTVVGSWHYDCDKVQHLYVYIWCQLQKNLVSLSRQHCKSGKFFYLIVFELRMDHVAKQKIWKWRFNIGNCQLDALWEDTMNSIETIGKIAWT